MPNINEYKCNKCEFSMPHGWGVYFYVVNDKGGRIVCGHPGEAEMVFEVLGKPVSSNVIRERTGFNSACVCLDCLHQFAADFGESSWTPFECVRTIPRFKRGIDKRECPECSSANVKTVLEMVGKVCPKCTEGIIEVTWTGWRS